MNHLEFWKNFRLGKELDISGRFIYNGLRYFDEIETLSYDEEIFEILYNLSVGLERLIKIAIILIEHDDSINQEEFEKSLISHTHLELIRRVKDKRKLYLDHQHNSFLSLLSTFYKTYRYGRYGIASVFTSTQEKNIFHLYLEKYLNVKINDDLNAMATVNDESFKKFIGDVVGKITTQLFEIISKEASRLNIYTNEIRCDSKAYKIFYRKEFIFNKENTLLKELLIHFINSKDTSGIFGLMKEVEPLEFDSGQNQEYLQSFFSDEKRMVHIDEMEELYNEIKKHKERLNILDVIGDSSIMLGDEGEEENF